MLQRNNMVLGKEFSAQIQELKAIGIGIGAMVGGEGVALPFY